jgi:exoribonuclease R
LKAIRDRHGALVAGLAAIREQYQLPMAFPEEVERAAVEATRRPLSAHVDRRDLPFVTLDPASSTDLDQAFVIEPAGGDLLLRYAIADVGWFVRSGDPIDAEAWARGETIYLPDGKVPLHPTVLSEGAASLLPDVDRPAIIFAVRVSPDGSVLLDGAERAIVRSRVKLAYANVDRVELPADFAELSRRIVAAEVSRGGARVDPPQQEVEPVPAGGYGLGFRPVRGVERDNASLSLAANMAIAKALLGARTGVFRTMPEPGKRARKRLRETALAFGLEWPSHLSLHGFERRLDPNDTRQAAMMLAIRRAGERAGYAPWQEGETPWHSAMAASYTHATAPLRRLTDRYTTQAALAVANGRPVPDDIAAAFARLPEVMDKADSKAAQVDSAVIELAEAVTMQDRIGETFEARVTDVDERGARAQLCTEPVVTRIAQDGLVPGDPLRLRLVEASPIQRRARFEPVAT